VTEILLGYSSLMAWRIRRTGKWLRMILVVIGSLALVTGSFVAIMTVTRTTASVHGTDTPFQGAVYVGANTCFTCHGDQGPDWSPKPSAQAVLIPPANPRAIVVNIVKSNGQVAIQGAASAYTTEDVYDSSGDQRYVITTEEGYAFLPSQWQWAKPAWETDNPLFWYSSCGRCHRTGVSLQASRFDGMGASIGLPIPSLWIARIGVEGRFI
jgi:cytochrome c553